MTEPLSGSDIAGGLATTAERVGDKWIINGEKRWIGGSDTADVIQYLLVTLQMAKLNALSFAKELLVTM